MKRFIISILSILILFCSVFHPVLFARNEAFAEETLEDGWHDIGSLRYYSVGGEFLRSCVCSIEDILYCFTESGEMLDNDMAYMLKGKAGNELWVRAMPGGELYVNEWVTILLQNDGKARYYYGAMGVAASGPVVVDDVLYLFDEQGMLQINKEIMIGDETWKSDEFGVLTRITNPPSETSEQNEHGEGGTTTSGDSGSEGGATTPGDSSSEEGGTTSGDGSGTIENSENQGVNTGGGEDQNQGDSPDSGSSEGCQELGNPTYKKNGWDTDEEGNTFYFVNDELLKDGMFRIGDDWFWFCEDGHLLKNGVRQVVLADNLTGFIRARQNGKLYCSEFFLDPENDAEYYYGADCLGASGFFEVGEELYYFFSDGRMAKSESFSYGGASYYADETGCVTARVFVDENGALLQNTCVVHDELLYYCDDHGDTERILDDGLYRNVYGFFAVFVREGRIVRTDWVEYAGNRYYFGTDANCLHECHVSLDGSQYLFRADGSLIRGGWVNRDGPLVYPQDSDHQFFADIDGALLTGLHEYREQYYLFDEYGRLLKGLNLVNGERHLSTSDGAYIGRLTVSGWNVIEGERYYLAGEHMVPEGAYIIDWQTYHFDSNGRMLHDCLAGDCLLDSDGHPASEGWVETPTGTFYVLDDQGTIARSQDLSIDNKNYYFDADGHMVIGEVTVDGEVRHYDENGVLIIEMDDGDNGERSDGEITDESDPDDDYKPENETVTTKPSEITYPDIFTAGDLYRTIGSAASGTATTAVTAAVSGKEKSPEDTFSSSDRRSDRLRQRSYSSEQRASIPNRDGLYTWRGSAWHRVSGVPGETLCIRISADGNYGIYRGAPITQSILVIGNFRFGFGRNGRAVPPGGIMPSGERVVSSPVIRAGQFIILKD